jgi:hypothetical protein
MPVGETKVTGSIQSFVDHTLGATANPSTGQNTTGIYKNNVLSLKGDGSLTNSMDVRGAFYRSFSNPSSGSVGEPWGNTPRGGIDDNAYKLDVDVTQTAVDSLTFNFQYFNIGAGYFSTAAARRESDVLLTEGSESAWYNWGNPIWAGGATADYTQGAASPKGRPSGTGTQNGLTDNDFMDFNESPAESVIGWKGLTALAKYEASNSPMSLELTRVSYNNNWQNYSATGPLYNVFAASQDRKTNIFVFKVNHNFQAMGGIDANLKLKRVDDKDGVDTSITSDDIGVLDNGLTLSAGNQLASQLYGTVSVGRYLRKNTTGGVEVNNSKSIYGVKFAYNLPGFELGMLTQWIQGYAGATKVQQYRMKTYAQVNF